MSHPLSRLFSRLWSRLRYTIDRTFRTGGRRHEFEYKYAAHGDYFGYQNRPYERTKYERTLACMRQWRMGRASALEIGCSVGVFTAMMAEDFEQVLAVDIASEALALARAEVGGRGNVAYLRSDLLSLRAGRRFDVIICAEVLMYIRPQHAAAVCQVLDSHLGEDGLVIEVSQQDREAGQPKFFHGWDKVLGAYFELIHRERFADPERPYEILAYRRRSTSASRSPG